MSWIGVADRTTGHTADCRIASEISEANIPTALLAHGSIMFEIAVSPDGQIPCRLISLEKVLGWERAFTFYLNADHSLAVECKQGSSRSYVRLSGQRPTTETTLRITYFWDAPARRGVLTTEDLAGGTIRQAEFSGCIPLPLDDALEILANGANCQLDDRITSLAIADVTVPIGPRASLASGTLVETADGLRPIEKLRTGDLVTTQANGVQPIRWIIKQELPAVGAFVPIRLQAPYFGLTRDITVTESQRLLISGPDTEYHFGKDAVFVEARDLVGHQAAFKLPTSVSETYYQILLDNHECINLSGTWADSLFVGCLAKSSAIMATTSLAPVPAAALPIHRQHTFPVLRDYETRALLDSLTA